MKGNAADSTILATRATAFGAIVRDQQHAGRGLRMFRLGESGMSTAGRLSDHPNTRAKHQGSHRGYLGKEGQVARTNSRLRNRGGIHPGNFRPAQTSVTAGGQEGRTGE